MDVYFQSIVGVEVYFQSITIKERERNGDGGGGGSRQCRRRRHQQQYGEEFVLINNEAKAVWENLHTLNIGDGSQQQWKVSQTDKPIVDIDANNGDVTITTALHVFEFPEPYMEEEQEELLWQQFINRVRALEKQRRSSSSKKKKKKLLKNHQQHHHRDDKAFAVIQDKDPVQSPISRGISSSSSSTKRRQQQQQQQHVPSAPSPNTVIVMLHSSSTPTTSPSSSCYTDGSGASSKDSSSISSETTPRNRGTSASSSSSLHKKYNDTTTIECKIASIVSDRIWGEDTEENAKRALQSLYKTFVDDEHCIIEKNCRMAYVLGAPLAVVEVMARHNTSAKIQEYGCELLSCMSCCKQQQQQEEEDSSGTTAKDQEQNESFLKLGGLWRVLRAMECFHDNPAVLGPACWFIGNVVDEALAQQVAGDCSLRATISAMKTHPSSVAVQEYGCYVLRNFIVRAGKCGATLVVDTGGIERIIAAINHHPDDVDVLREGCTILAKLAELNLANHRRRIIHAKGLVALSEIIRIYQHDDNDGTVVEKASRAMSILVAQSSSSSSGE